MDERPRKDEDDRFDVPADGFSNDDGGRDDGLDPFGAREPEVGDFDAERGAKRDRSAPRAVAAWPEEGQRRPRPLSPRWPSLPWRRARGMRNFANRRFAKRLTRRDKILAGPGPSWPLFAYSSDKRAVVLPGHLGGGTMGLITESGQARAFLRVNAP